MAAAVEGRMSLSANSKNTIDEDIESIQRLSFVSTSTGYSSARSSLRSSEISDDSSPNHVHDVSVERRLIPRETLLSETRRLKLLKGGNISQLDRIAMELLETERCYVNDLNDIIQGYLNFFIDHREEFQMTVDDVSNTFGCIERIFLFNRKLFHQLDGALLNVVQMAKCFVENVEGFDDYVTYCTNYQKMVDTLSKLTKNNVIVETLASRQASLGHALPLSAYLLKPVQRVLKYHLFMENILKQSGETRNLSDTDRAIIKQALNCMTSQAEKINEEKKRAEHWERVRELQVALQRWCTDQSEDLSKYGDLLLEATFKLAGSKTNRQLFLFEEMLLIVKERNGALICRDYIMCSSIMLNESISSDPLAFQVISYDNPKIQYVFLASCLEQKRQWIKELKRMMLDHYTVEIPERTKKLMLDMDNTIVKPTHITSELDVDTVTSKMNRKIPKYLEKRRKSIDANSASRPSQRRNRSGSTSRCVSKASSTGNLMPTLNKLDLTTIRNEPLTCTCNHETEAQPSTSTGISIFKGSNSLINIEHNAASSFSNLFLRRKTNDNNTSRVKLFSNRKKNSSHSSGQSLNIDHPSLTVAPDECVGCNSNDTESIAMRCTCNEERDSARSVPPDSRIRPSSEQIETTFAELYKELHLFITNTEALDEDLDSNLTDRNTALRQHAATNRLDALVNGSRPDSLSSWQTRCRSKSLSKLDEVFSFVPHIDSPLSADRSTDGIIVTPIDDEHEEFINGATFGKLLDEELKSKLKEAEEEDEPIHSINWADSPLIRDRIRVLGSAQNLHHRRRTSQVAEQVWRLRQRQSAQKNNENSLDNNVYSSHTVLTESPSRRTMNEKDKTNGNLINDSGIDIGHKQNINIIISHPRQRTPLTVEQCAQLNDVLLEPNLGVVKEMVKQLEKPIRSTTNNRIIS